MGWGAVDPEPDIAEVAEQRRMPTWAKRALWIGLPVLAVVLFVVARSISDDYRIAVDPVRFDQRYEAGIDVRVTNLTDGLQGVIIRLPSDNGLVLHDVIGVQRDFPNQAPIYVVEIGQETTLTLRVRPTDCAKARAAASEPAELTLEIGPLIGRKDTVRTSLGTWDDLIPPACDDAPNRGLPKLADQNVLSAGSAVVVRLDVDNAGGLPLDFAGATLDRGVPAEVLMAANVPEQRRLGIGRGARVELAFRAGDCRVPEDGPARVTLRFTTPGTGKTETLRVDLADSWTNLLGACDPRR